MIRRAAVPAALTFLLPILVTAGVGTSSAAPSAPRAAATTNVAALGTLARANLGPTPWKDRPKYAPGSTTPAWGPSFNNPTQGTTANRRNIERVYRMIQATKGYKGIKRPSQCPTKVSNYPNIIRIALYSFSDGRIADALIRAHRRCVSVKVLMNDHLSNSDVPAFGRLQRALGYNRDRRSWARRCKDGCRGSAGPLHTKMYLFSKTGKADHVVAFGSTNMTGKAANVQWNDLFVWKSRVGMYDQFMTIFKESAKDRRAPAPVERNYVNGGVTTMFWPQPGHTRATDRVLAALQQVRCGARPTGGTGFDGHTAVSINIHAMEGDRGLYIAQHIVRMRKAGCRVRVLYGLIAPRIHRTFKAGGVATRRTIFDRDDNGYTDMYTHMKYVGINGVVGRRHLGPDRSTPARRTSPRRPCTATRSGSGSRRATAWRKYQQLFDMIWKSDYYSNPKYAFYQQSDNPIHARMDVDPNRMLVTSEDLED